MAFNLFCIVAIVGLTILVIVQGVLFARAAAERKRVLEELRAQKEFSESVIQSAHEIIVSVDMDRRVTMFNKSAENAFGYSQDEVLGKNVSLLYADETEGRDIHMKTWGEGVFAGEIWNRRKSGEVFPCFLCASVQRDRHGRPIGVMGISLDISDQKQIEAERERLSKMKDEFLAIASHDLKSPLGSIAGYAQLLMKMAPPGEPMTDETYGFVQRIQSLSGVMQRIVEDFLDFCALQEGQIRLAYSETSLNDIATDVVEHYAPCAAEKGIVVTADLAEDLPIIQADPVRVEQVVENLVSNAVKFCWEGCRAVVRTRVENGEVALEVTDTGPGLSEQDLLKVFMKYARLENAPTGGEKSSGLGLSICKELIELHGGRIGARNNPEGGSTFWFRLPVDGSG